MFNLSIGPFIPLEKSFCREAVGSLHDTTIPLHGGPMLWGCGEQWSALPFWQGEGSYFSMRDDYAEDPVISLLICSETPKAKDLTIYRPQEEDWTGHSLWPLPGQGWCLVDGASMLAKGTSLARGGIRPPSHVPCLSLDFMHTFTDQFATGQSCSKSECTLDFTWESPLVEIFRYIFRQVTR